MKTYILRMDFPEGFLEILFQTDSKIPFALGDFYYSSRHTLTENQIRALDRICGRDFLKTYFYLDRFCISEKVVHVVSL